MTRAGDPGGRPGAARHRDIVPTGPIGGVGAAGRAEPSRRTVYRSGFASVSLTG